MFSILTMYLLRSLFAVSEVKRVLNISTILIVCKLPCLLMDFVYKGRFSILCYFAGLSPTVPVLTCKSNLSEVFLKLAFPKKKAKFLKNSCEEVHFLVKLKVEGLLNISQYFSRMLLEL